MKNVCNVRAKHLLWCLIPVKEQPVLSTLFSEPLVWVAHLFVDVVWSPSVSDWAIYPVARHTKPVKLRISRSVGLWSAVKLYWILSADTYDNDTESTIREDPLTPSPIRTPLQQPSEWSVLFFRYGKIINEYI